LLWNKLKLSLIQSRQQFLQPHLTKEVGQIETGRLPEVIETDTSASTKKTPGFGIVLALVGLMAIVLRKRSF